MNCSELETLIKTAFQGVKLDGGVSLRQAEVMDRWGQGLTKEEFQALPLGENTDNWIALSPETLEEFPYLSFLDAKGFRFYIPAFMLSVLADYQRSSMRVISTLMALYPKPDNHGEYHMEQYSLLNQKQSSAIAQYLQVLPSLVELDDGDQTRMERAMRNYWHDFV